jgi:hypothetical protein
VYILWCWKHEKVSETVNNTRSIIFIQVLIAMFILTACYTSSPSTTELSDDELIDMLLRDPSSSDVWDAEAEFILRKPTSPSVAFALVEVLAYPRHDTSMAGKALVSMGKNAEPTIPQLIFLLKHDRDEVRLWATIVFASIGDSATCAVPSLAPGLWDSDMFVRTATAISLTEITGLDLVREIDRFDPELPDSFGGDDPSGTTTNVARNWWLDYGDDMEWSVDSSLCDPSISD